MIATREAAAEDAEEDDDVVFAGSNEDVVEEVVVVVVVKLPAGREGRECLRWKCESLMGNALDVVSVAAMC